MPPKKINQLSGMPQMEAAFEGWTIGIVLTIITQSLVDGLTVDNENTISVKGTWQPLSAEEIALKPDGERSWPWFDLHIMGGQSPLLTNDRVIYNGVRYKVMAVKDYSLNNYSEFHLVADYQEG